MRFPAVVVASALIVGAASCGENNPPKQQGQASIEDKPSKPTKSAAAASAVQSNDPDSAAIPKGASWTILCAEITGPGHIERARQIKQNLVKTSGMRDWHLLHQDEGSLLFYGYYKNYAEPRAKADRARIDAMADGAGNRPFRMAHFAPLDAADPAGPPEWNLVNAKGYWTLQIAAYKDSPERKQYAVDAVKAAREQGIEAYYYHGETMSLVCVGTWPREAVRMADENVRPGDAGDLKVVLPPLPPDVKSTPELKGEGGRRLHVEAGHNDIVDPTLKAAMDAYPTMAINGTTYNTTRTDPRTGKTVTTADASFPVKIPHNDPSLLDPNAIPVPPPPDSATFAPPSNGLRRGNGS